MKIVLDSKFVWRRQMGEGGGITQSSRREVKESMLIWPAF